MFTITNEQKEAKPKKEKKKTKKLYENDARSPIVCYRRMFSPFCAEIFEFYVFEYLSLFCGHVNTVRSLSFLLLIVWLVLLCPVCFFFVEIEGEKRNYKKYNRLLCAPSNMNKLYAR